MSWQERLREASYTPAGGDRLPFQYENVKQAFAKRTSAYNFPDADGTFIQDLGSTGRRFPMRVFFSGPDYDLSAALFEAALLTPGVGELEHPIYGRVSVVPFGTITRRDDLKTAANQAIIEVVFWESNALIFPSSQKDAGASVLSSLSEFTGAQAVEFAENLDSSSTSKIALFRARYEQLLTVAENALRPIAETEDAVRQAFNAVSDSINRGIDVLIADPLTLAFQTAELIQVPGRAVADIAARLGAYANLVGDIIGGPRDILPNDFYNDDLYASSMVSGAIVSAVNAGANTGLIVPTVSRAVFETKTAALTAAIEVLQLEADVTAWRDDLRKDLDLIDSGATYQKLQEAAAITAGFLVEISFSLKQERRITLDRARTVVDLVAELYGVIDSELDFFIRSNRLTGSEIIELPAGGSYVYYA